MSIKSVLGRKRRLAAPTDNETSESASHSMSEAGAAATASPPQEVLGDTVEKAQARLAEASHRVSRRRAGLHQLVGFTLSNYHPCETLTKPLAIGIAIEMARMLADPAKQAQIHKLGLDEIASLIRPEKPVFVLVDGLESKVTGQLRSIGMTVAGPFMSGRPNIPSLIALAEAHKLTVLRYDDNGDKQVLVKSGETTGLLADVLREHEDAFEREMGLTSKDEEATVSAFGVTPDDSDGSEIETQSAGDNLPAEGSPGAIEAGHVEVATRSFGLSGQKARMVKTHK